MSEPQSQTGLGRPLDLFVSLSTLVTLINPPFLPFPINLAHLIGLLRAGDQTGSLWLCLSLTVLILACNLKWYSHDYYHFLTRRTFTPQWSSADCWLFCLTCLELNYQQSSLFIFIISNGS